MNRRVRPEEAELSASQMVRANLALLGMSLIWALNFSIAKQALASVPPLAFNALRFPLAVGVVTMAMARRGSIMLPAREDRPRVLVLGLVGNVLYQLLFIFGLDHSRAGTASVLLAGTPIVTALLAAALGQERVSGRVWAGAAATIAGITLVVAGAGSGGGGRQTLLGDVLLIVATVSWAAFAVGCRDLVRRYGALPVTAWTLWGGTIVIVLIGIPDTVQLDLAGLGIDAWLAIIYAGAFSIGVAYMLWSYGLSLLGPTRTGVFSNLVPVFALAVAWVWLGEQPGTVQLAGAFIIIAGVTMAQTRERPQPVLPIRSPPP
jgi:drug/metabolite transporter (DMT)-like permease